MIKIYVPKPLPARSNTSLPSDLKDYYKINLNEQVLAQSLGERAVRATPEGSLLKINLSIKHPQILRGDYIN